MSIHYHGIGGCFADSREFCIDPHFFWRQLSILSTKFAQQQYHKNPIEMARKWFCFWCISMCAPRIDADNQKYGDFRKKMNI